MLVNLIDQKHIFKLSLVFLTILLSNILNAQSDSLHLIQISGSTVMSEEGHELPYVKIRNINQKNTTVSNYNGVYSIIAEPGDSLRFTFVGFRPRTYVVPHIVGNFLYHNVLLEMDTFYLPESIVRPLPSKETFAYQFVYSDIDNDLLAIASNNTEYNQLNFLAQVLIKDGKENSGVEMKNYQQGLQKYNQLPSQSIFNPGSWLQFLDYINSKTKK